MVDSSGVYRAVPQRSFASASRDLELQSVIQRVAREEQHALVRLYDLTSRLVFGLLLRILGDHSEAEEVLLDVYTQVWRQAGAYNTRRGSPLAWLTTIARTRAIDRLRSGKMDKERTTSLGTSADASGMIAYSEGATVSIEQQMIVRQALTALSLEQREVIELAYYSGLTHSEIASKLK